MTDETPRKSLHPWWNPISATLLVMVCVGIIFGVRFDISQHNQCVYNNSFSQAWVNLFQQQIHNESINTVDSPAVKASRIKDLTDAMNKFPHQAGC